MSRERWLVLYSLTIGALGWAWLLASDPFTAPLWLLVLFVLIALIVESARFRVTGGDAHSLVGIPLLTAAFALGPGPGGLVAAISGLLFGMVQPLFGRAPRSFYTLAARPLLRSGVRALGILAGYALAVAATGNPPETATWYLLAIICYPLVVQFNRIARAYLQGGRTGLLTWWRGAWFPMLAAEFAPLPAAWLGAAIYTRLTFGYFLLACVILCATAVTVRRASLNIQRQRRSVRELAQLNQVSRAIIRSSLDVEALCELVYREASKLVDTSSFHLGLFDPEGDEYTLVVRVQDRVRLPPLTVRLPAGDGIIGWMRETGRALLVHDFAAEMERLPARPRYQSERPPRSGIYVPLIADDAVIGTISIQSYQPNAFDADDMRLLSLIADQAAVAIAKARAFDEARQRAVQLQAIHEVSQRITAILDLDELLDSVVALIRERFGYHPVQIFTLEPDGALTFRASTGSRPAPDVRVGVGLVGTALAQGAPLLVNDVAADARYIADAPGTRAELAVPLRFGDEYLGVLDVQTAAEDGFSDADMFVMQTLAGQIAVAIESARSFTAQREEAWTLNALLQVSENLHRAESLADLLPAIVRLPPLLLGCDRCYCLLHDTAPAFVPLAAYGVGADGRAALLEQRIAEGDAPLLLEAMQRAGPTIARGTEARAGVGATLASFGGGAFLAAALNARGAPLGVLVADYSDAGREFAGRVLTLYQGMAGQVAGALESALLAEDAARAERLDQELRVAREIQTALLPARPPALPGWSIAADWQSARLVGGDFYDFWLLAEKREARGLSLEDHAATHTPQASRPVSLGFVIADVSDKGVPAAMFMALSRSLVRAAALDGSPPDVALERANRWITRDSESAMFVTVFYGILDPASGRLCYTNAGHNPPLLIGAADGAVRELSTRDMALGVLEGASFHAAEATLLPGDVLLAYTDGITEAINDAGEPFGVARLREAAVVNRGRGAGEILAAVIRALTAFAGGRPPFDDLTLVVIKRDAHSAFDIQRSAF